MRIERIEWDGADADGAGARACAAWRRRSRR